MRKVILISITAVLMAAVASAAFSQSSPWGGRGIVSVFPSMASRNSTVQIQYQVNQSRGSGTADFRCEVTNPDGVIHIAGAVSSEWQNGQARATFTYPNDFGGTDIPCTTSNGGTYQIQCYWYIQGYGVNGKTAAAGGAFVVQ